MEGEDQARSDVRIPALPEDFDVTSLPMDPFEGFILSRIDGRMGLQEIADSTGASMDQVIGVITTLELEGVLSWVEPPKVPSRPAPKAPPSRRPLSQTPGRGFVRTRPPPPGASRLLYDPAELEEADVELDVDRRRQILDAFYRLEELDHYQLLEVSRSVDKKAIRDSYFRLSKLFHPDTLYGKELGSYKAKMVAVFKRITDAYEVLGRKKKRAKYDEYLLAHDRLMGIERQIEHGTEAATHLEQEVLGAAEQAVVTPTSSEPPKPTSSKPPKATSSKPPKATSSKPPRIDAKERRRRAKELLERRLRGSTRSPPPSSPPARKSGAPTDANRDDLLRGLASSLKQVAKITGGVARVERHIQDAKIAAADGDLVGALNALRLATALEPERADIRKTMDEIQGRLSKDLAETYQKQALYEEEQGNWTAAARSWAKVSEGRPGKAAPARRTAESLLKAEGDLRKARDFAQKAVDIHGSVVNLLVLAEVFIAAGMTVSAKKELDEAAKLDPKDQMVKNLIRQLK